MRIYYSNSVPSDIISLLQKEQVELVKINDPDDTAGMFWRFYALSDRDAEYVIFRDAESRLNEREFQAVTAWIASKKNAHIMRDHPYHPFYILGGMWGCRGSLFLNIKTLIQRYKPNGRWGDDQIFLEKIIYPKIKNSVLIHDSCTDLNLFAYDFPSKRNEFCNFVGESFSENDDRGDTWKLVFDFEKHKKKFSSNAS